MIMIPKISNIDNTNFENFKHKKNSLLYVWAEWCEPCKQISPIITELSSKYDNISFGKLNVDENSDIISELSIRNIPAIILFKDGKIINKLVGGLTSQKIIDFIETN